MTSSTAFAFQADTFSLTWVCRADTCICVLQPGWEEHKHFTELLCSVLTCKQDLSNCLIRDRSRRVYPKVEVFALDCPRESYLCPQVPVPMSFLPHYSERSHQEFSISWESFSISWLSPLRPWLPVWRELPLLFIRFFTFISASGSSWEIVARWIEETCRQPFPFED